MTIRHWLVRVAEKEQLSRASHLVLEMKTPTQDAWATVLAMCKVTQSELTEYVADHFRLKVANLKTPNAEAIKFVPEKMARSLCILPLRVTATHFVVAASDPTNYEVEQAVAFACNRTPVMEVAAPAQIIEAINIAYSPFCDSPFTTGLPADRILPVAESPLLEIVPSPKILEQNDTRYSMMRAVENITAGLPAELIQAVQFIEETQGQVSLGMDEVETAPVVKLTNLVLREAVKQGASDIHIEPGREGGTVRFRIDGVLRAFMRIPMVALDRVVSRIKILSRLDISERFRPQDGRARIQIAGHHYDLRISIVPTRMSEKAVVRILDSSKSLHLDTIGILPRELRSFKQLLSFREGIVMVTGPTGSGKTTTLYSAIKDLALGDINICTVEDPVEYELSGVAQIQVDTPRGVTFASALRALLRQDPDVMFIGEIRDAETAAIAAQAAMTGHLVLATTHTNDAVSVVSRLSELGLQRGVIAETLRGVMSQRLIRRLCGNCVEFVNKHLTPSEMRLSILYGMEPWIRTVGCPSCRGTGFVHRLPVCEVLVATPALKKKIASGAISTELHPLALEEGMRSIRNAALELVSNGDTSLAELDRVLGNNPDEPMPHHKPVEATLVVRATPIIFQDAA